MANPGFNVPSSPNISPTVNKAQYKIKNPKLTAILILKLPFFDIIPKGIPSKIKIKQAIGIAIFLCNST